MPIRVVLPVTTGLHKADVSTTTAGVLVLINETWYERYGLHERMVGEIVFYRDPVTGALGTEAEIGSDPILFTAPFPGSGSDWAGRSDRVHVTGPIGMTFDTDTSSPQFNGTAFLVDVIPPEELVREAQTWVAKGVRFLGGCCGTGVEHIQGLANALDDLQTQYQA